MRRFEVVFGAEAETELLHIYRWIYEASRDPNVAGRYLDRLIGRCERIGDAPHGGRPRDDLEPGLRTVPFERSAVIAYPVGAESVTITNVFYGGRNFEALIQSARADDEPAP